MRSSGTKLRATRAIIGSGRWSFRRRWSLLEPLPPTVLELACGNGNFARQLAGQGVSVTATDGSEQQLDRARERSDGYRIQWIRVDVTERSSLAALSGAAGAPFGAAVCNMALMDIAEITPLFDMLPLALAEDAPFVFSVLHPVFRPGQTRLFRERTETEDGQFIEESEDIATRSPQSSPTSTRFLLFSSAFDRRWESERCGRSSFVLSPASGVQAGCALFQFEIRRGATLPVQSPLERTETEDGQFIGRVGLAY